MEIKQETAILTQKQASEFAGVSVRTIGRWCKEYDIRYPDGSFNVQMLAELAADRQDHNSDPKNPLKRRLMEADLKHRQIKAELSKMQLAVKRGELLRAADVEARGLQRVMEVRRVLLSLVRKLPPLLRGRPMADMISIVRKEVYYCLEVFAGQRILDDSAEDVIAIVQRMTQDEREALIPRLKKIINL